VQNSPQFGTYFEGLNPVYAQELKTDISIRHLPMSIPIVFVSSFHFLSTEFWYINCTSILRAACSIQVNLLDCIIQVFG
jgi:hypothetical protein